MSAKPIIAVTGATGKQGGAVVEALLARGNYAVRAITRKTDSEAAKALAAKGVEVVAANIDDKASLVEAFKGAHGAFFVTNFWEHLDIEREIQQGKNLGDAGKEAGLKHVVWSTLENVKALVGSKIKPIGNYVVPHFDGKGLISDYYKSIGLPVTDLYTSFYYDNWAGMMPPRKGEDGDYHIYLNVGETAMAAVSTEDIGKVAAAAFDHADSIGQNIYAVGQRTPLAEYAAVFSKVLGKKFHYHAIPTEAVAAWGFPGADDLANMFEFYRDFPELMKRNVEDTKKFAPDAKNFEEWLTANKALFANL
eukprot:TRINITY_DN6419_c0_g1_i1.p2 TRINITY_DN6419_c0_g1~~TRINITY_DN6419_c0_g1_i1.p2  ORF type:complete len:307 (-),score=79.25 TRINITY_DN6419_c0_g1_i1:253-1173(-)